MITTRVVGLLAAALAAAALAAFGLLLWDRLTGQAPADAPAAPVQPIQVAPAPASITIPRIPIR